MRERWLNNLDPNLNLGPWSDVENQMLLQKFDEYGSCEHKTNAHHLCRGTGHWQVLYERCNGSERSNAALWFGVECHGGLQL